MLGYDSPQEYIRDRWYDEVDLEPRLTCRTCEFYRHHPEHEEHGWCIQWRQWVKADEECEDE